MSTVTDGHVYSSWTEWQMDMYTVHEHSDRWRVYSSWAQWQMDMCTVHEQSDRWTCIQFMSTVTDGRVYSSWAQWQMDMCSCVHFMSAVTDACVHFMSTVTDGYEHNSWAAMIIYPCVSARTKLIKQRLWNISLSLSLSLPLPLFLGPSVLLLAAWKDDPEDLTSRDEPNKFESLYGLQCTPKPTWTLTQCEHYKSRELILCFYSLQCTHGGFSWSRHNAPFKHWHSLRRSMLKDFCLNYLKGLEGLPLEKM